MSTASGRGVEKIERTADERHAYLLGQDDSIPGNSKDGFRFHYLIFVIISTPIYLWLELSFGVRLLDHIANASGVDQTESIEHWGRLISGMAVSLLFLSQWFGQCEKWNRPWKLRVIMSVAIVAIAIPMTWVLQGQIIDFYVAQASYEVSIAIPLMIIFFGVGLYAVRRWLKTYGQRRLARPVITISVLVALMGATAGAIWAVAQTVPWAIAKFSNRPSLEERLGDERQQAALLSLIRRGMQIGAFTLRHDQTRDLAQAIYGSPEGKAALAMFPVLGEAADQSRYRAESPRVLKEVMYADWDEMYGAQTYQTFQDLLAELKEIHEGKYRVATDNYLRNVKRLGTTSALLEFNKALGDSLENVAIKPALSLDDFLAEAGVAKFLGKRMACFDCQFYPGMSHAEFTYEIFIVTRSDSVRSAMDVLEDEAHFASGRDGETAARSYWVPIWALLFSMIGAFTHIFKLTFSAAEYAFLRAFHRVHAADSRLADQIISITRRGLMVVLASVMLFIYFFENRITDQSSYKQLHAAMFHKSPIIGGLAAHWTINAQGILYPFTKKICPDWLAFADDPFDHYPLLLLQAWVARDDY